jgi:hypothetical protein
MANDDPRSVQNIIARIRAKDGGPDEPTRASSSSSPEELRQLIDAARIIVPLQSQWTHTKRPFVYTVQDVAIMQVNHARDHYDLQVAVIYTYAGITWVRPFYEFCQKFTRATCGFCFDGDRDVVCNGPKGHAPPHQYPWPKDRVS